MNGKPLQKSFSKLFKVHDIMILTSSSEIIFIDLYYVELSLGELMHNEMFGLFEAMSAIEMMDPKMDAGMCCNKNTEAPLTFETAVSVSVIVERTCAINLLCSISIPIRQINSN